MGKNKKGVGQARPTEGRVGQPQLLSADWQSAPTYRVALPSGRSVIFQELLGSAIMQLGLIANPRASIEQPELMRQVIVPACIDPRFSAEDPVPEGCIPYAHLGGDEFDLYNAIVLKSVQSFRGRGPKARAADEGSPDPGDEPA